MKKILITGSNGFIGQKLLAALRSEGITEVIASSLHADKGAAQAGFAFETMDITSPAQVSACFEKHSPDTVIHTAALSRTDYCETHPDECRDINIQGTENVLQAAEKHKSHFLFLSTDFVFDGTQGPYREEDAPHPVSVYGKSKWISEQRILKSGTSWAIIRTILVFGFLPVMPGPNIITFVKNNLERGEKIKVVSDQYRMPTLAEDLADGCLQIARQKAEGIFHLSGNEMTSIFNFARQIAGTFGLDETLIEPVSTASLHEKAPRPRRTGFFLDKAQQCLHYKQHSLSEGLAIVKKQIQAC